MNHEPHMAARGDRRKDNVFADCGARRPRSETGAPDDRLLDETDRLGWIKAFRAGRGAIHDRVAAIETERVVQIVEPLLGGFITTVHDPAIGLQQHCRAKIAVTGPPPTRACGGAAEAQDAFPIAVDLCPLRDRLQSFSVRRWLRHSHILLALMARV